MPARRLLLITMLAACALALAPAGAARRSPAAKVVIVVAGRNHGYVVGGFARGAWQKGKVAAGWLKGSLRYQLYDSGRHTGTATGRPDGFDDHSGYLVRLTPAPGPGQAPIALAGATWNPLPRRIERPIAGDLHRQIVLRLVRQAGLTSPFEIADISRADLDGDGKAEEVMDAGYVGATDNDMFNRGDYSLLAVIRQGPAGPKVQVLKAYYCKVDADAGYSAYHLRGLLDLDGDGALEIVVASHGYERFSTCVFDLRGGVWRQVLEAGGGS